MNPAGIVDAHHHLWDPARRRYPWMQRPGLEPLHRPFGPADLAREAAAAGVSATVLVQTVAETAETREFLSAATASDGLVAAVVGWVDLRGAAVADEVAELRAAPGGGLLRGVRHQVEDEPDPDWLLRADVRRGATAVADAGLVHDLLVRPDQLPAATDLVRALPSAVFVLDHAAKPPLDPDGLAVWRERVTDLARCGDVFCKVSGLFTLLPPGGGDDLLEPVVRHLLEVFGPRRLVFGTDWPVSTLAGGYGDVVRRTTALLRDLSGAERDAVLAGTARSLYGVPGPAAG
ncbi:amidohydrolase family protein [Paenibacillus sp. TRM 82003]|uniref:amidohydrolase family protein n=1 Tax=Kineococcus sp. TRM81007 TaxID=2925831 RepID=UPI001F59458E|nr:amidohydrolase family protein [Kineococcus sp. TRM81007]MCI2238005.1 amidohydrolase family protein [Kineococcus sp. TRM81007]MCI3926019.1 amidohydrolase family protein [Paenibacillus sp. TRM 82003]